jgi:hypothetical protein
LSGAAPDRGTAVSEARIRRGGNDDDQTSSAGNDLPPLLSAMLAQRLYSAAEMIDHAADLFNDFAGIVHDNERRWRAFQAHVKALADTLQPGADQR